jgi:hypothetical protein
VGDDPAVASRKSFSFLRNFIFSVYIVASIELLVIRTSLSRGPVSTLATMFYTGTFRIYRLLLNVSGSVKSSQSYLHSFYPSGVLGGIAAQLTYLILGACLAALLVVAVRAIASEEVSRVLWSPRLPLVGLTTCVVSWWRSDGVSASFPQKDWPSWMFGYAPGAYYVGALLLSAGVMVYMTFRRRHMTFPMAFTYGGFLALHFGFWFVTGRVGGLFWVTVLLLSVLAACRGLVWLWHSEPEYR